MSLGDTIVAQSTPYGFGGIAVVRLSGADSIKILKTISKQIKNPKSWVAQKTKIYHKKDVLDETVVVCYNKPKSFTGENMVEISCHGGEVVKNSIVLAVLDFYFFLPLCCSPFFFLYSSWTQKKI